jgi:hypothetical protein
MFSFPILFVSSCSGYRFIGLLIGCVLHRHVSAAIGAPVGGTPIFEAGRALLFSSLFKPSVRIGNLTANHL